MDKCKQTITKQQQKVITTAKNKPKYNKGKCLSLCLKVDETKHQFHSIGEATKKEYQNALMVEDSRFKVKECDLVANVLKWKYLEKSMAVVLCKIQ